MSFPLLSQAASPLDVVINEIAWMGTKANSADEWIELYNNTPQAISLEGWGLYEAGGAVLIEPLTGTISPNAYYLIERTDDATIKNIPADQEPTGWGGSGLNNKGEYLRLLDQNSSIIDEINCTTGWFAGEASPNYATMERKDTQNQGSGSGNWGTNNYTVGNGLDADGNKINGTPGTENSVKNIPQPTAPEPIPTPSPLPEPEPPLPPVNTTPAGSLPELPPENFETLNNITYPSGIIFNEILPSPKGPDEIDEWIEIFNKNNFEVNLSGWKIQDTAGAMAVYIFPQGSKIGPKNFMVLSRPTTKISLNNNEDGLKIIQPNENILDSINYQNAPTGSSYILAGDSWLWSDILTPGSGNIAPVKITPTTAGEDSTGNSSVSEEKEINVKQVASVGEQAVKTGNYFLIIIAMLFAFLSGVVVLLLKKVATK